MADGGRSPRIWIDFEQGAVFGSSAASIGVFEQLRASFGTFTEAWLFAGDTAPLVRGFYYPPGAHERYRIPRGLGPRMVLIDNFGDHLWLSGLSCGSDEKADGAMTVLSMVGFEIPPGAVAGDQEPALAGFDEMHFVDGRLIGGRRVGQPIPTDPPGKTFVRGGRLVCRMEFDKGRASALDLAHLWGLATEPHGWLGRPIELTLYEDRTRSEQAGHDGCQLIAVGQSGRELWLQLPEPDDYDRLSPGRRREHYEGAFTEYQAVERDIFLAVGIDLDPPDHRPLLKKLLGQHPVPPQVIHWP